MVIEQQQRKTEKMQPQPLLPIWLSQHKPTKQIHNVKPQGKLTERIHLQTHKTKSQQQAHKTKNKLTRQPHKTISQNMRLIKTRSQSKL